MVETMLWFTLYLLVIAALATWRSHHDALRRRKQKGQGPAFVPARMARVRPTHRYRSPRLWPRRAGAARHPHTALR